LHRVDLYKYTDTETSTTVTFCYVDITDHYFTLVGLHDIAMSDSVCLSACISKKTTCLNFLKFSVRLYMLTVAATYDFVDYWPARHPLRRHCAGIADCSRLQRSLARGDGGG